MEISEARTLKSGMSIFTDEGARITVKQPLALSLATSVHENIDKVKFLWVGTTDGVWPSNRLSFVAPRLTRKRGLKHENAN